MERFKQKKSYTNVSYVNCVKIVPLTAEFNQKYSIEKSEGWC